MLLAKVVFPGRQTLKGAAGDVGSTVAVGGSRRSSRSSDGGAALGQRRPPWVPAEQRNTGSGMNLVAAATPTAQRCVSWSTATHLRGSPQESEPSHKRTRGGLPGMGDAAGWGRSAAGTCARRVEGSTGESVREGVGRPSRHPGEVRCLYLRVGFAGLVDASNEITEGERGCVPPLSITAAFAAETTISGTPPRARMHHNNGRVCRADTAPQRRPRCARKKIERERKAPYGGSRNTHRSSKRRREEHREKGRQSGATVHDVSEVRGGAHDSRLRCPFAESDGARTRTHTQARRERERESEKRTPVCVATRGEGLMHASPLAHTVDDGACVLVLRVARVLCF